MTTSDLLLTLSELITKRYPDRVHVSVLPVAEDPPGVRLHEVRVRQAANPRREIVMSIVGGELPRTLTIRYKPESKKTSALVSEEALFIVNGEKLTIEGFVRHVFTPWFGGNQVF